MKERMYECTMHGHTAHSQIQRSKCKVNTANSEYISQGSRFHCASTLQVYREFGLMHIDEKTESRENERKSK